MKTTATTVFICLFLVFVTGSSLKLYFKANSRANRMETNLIAANATAEAFKTKNGHNASKLQAQELTIQELRRVNPAIISQLKNLYIPPRLATSYTQTKQEMKAEITAPVKDSIVVPARTTINAVPREPEKIKVLDYSDEWIKIHAELAEATGKVSVLATDTLFTSIYKGERRRPWLWVFSKRKLTVAGTNVSPYVDVVIIQAGVIKK